MVWCVLYRVSMHIIVSDTARWGQLCYRSSEKEVSVSKQLVKMDLLRCQWHSSAV
jgi:hypothetical protein